MGAAARAGVVGFGVGAWADPLPASCARPEPPHPASAATMSAMPMTMAALLTAVLSAKRLSLSRRSRRPSLRLPWDVAMKRPSRPRGKPHRHVAVTTYLLHQVGGLPYEVERTVCRNCGRVLTDKPLRRATT